MFDQALAYAERDTIRCEYSENRKGPSETWVAISFPQRDGILMRYGHAGGPLGVRMSNLPGHILVAFDVKTVVRDVTFVL